MSRLEGTQLQFTAQPLAIDTSFRSDSGGGSDLNSILLGGSSFVSHQLNEEWTVDFSMAGFFGLGLDSEFQTALHTYFYYFDILS